MELLKAVTKGLEMWKMLCRLGGGMPELWHRPTEDLPSGPTMQQAEPKSTPPRHPDDTR